MAKNNWLKDYEEFVNADAVPPKEVSNQVVQKIGKLLNPNPFLIFSKLFSINIFVGFLSLSICHQFGLNPFNTERSLDDWFMHVGGHQACMVLCGIVFLSVTIASAGLALSIEEVRAFRKNKTLQTISLSLFSLAFLFLIGAEFAVEIGLLWLAGAIIGGLVSTEVLWQLKKSAA